MILSDKDIKKVIKEGRLAFTPELQPDQIGPSSIDLKLSNVFKLFDLANNSLLDVRKGIPNNFLITHTIEKDAPFILHPNNFILASTVEYIKIPDNMAVRVEGKSSLARMGILVHTAGFCDPGFEGTITLEISNQSNLAVAIYPGMYICQVAIEELSSPAEVPYNKRKKSLYLKQKGPTGADIKNLFESKNSN